MKNLVLVFILSLFTIVKINAQAFQWVKTQGDIQSNGAITIASDGSNLISAGLFALPITFGNQTFASNGQSGYLVKQNSAGSPLWAKHIIGVQSLNKVETDLNQNIILTGKYRDSLIISNLIFNDRIPNGAPQIRNFVAKFSPTGILLWAEKLPDTDAYYSSITTDGTGNIYFASTYKAPITIGTTLLTPPTAGTQDVFIVKYNPSGNLQWVRATGGLHGKFNFSMIGSLTDGLFLGCFTQATNTELFIRKYDGAGTQLWNKTITNNNLSQGFAMEMDQSENIYLIGSNSLGVPTTLTFGNLSLSLNGTNNGATLTNNVFLAKLNTSGTWKWAKKLATGNYASYAFRALSKANNTLYFTGAIHGNMNFGNIPLSTTYGKTDGFHLKTDTAGNPLKAFKMQSSTSNFGINELAMDNQENNFFSGGFHGTLTLGLNTFINNSPPMFLGGPLSYLNFLAKTLDNPNYLTGTLFVDVNANGIKDAGEITFTGGLVEVNPGGAFAASDSIGKYNFSFPSGNFNLQILQPSNHYTFAPANHSVSFPATGQIQTKDFAIQPIPNRNDVKISVTNITPARPGFELKYLITYQNVGTTTLTDSIRLTYQANHLTYLGATVAPAHQQTGKLQWFYQPLAPTEKRNIEVRFTVAATTPINTLLNTIAFIKPFTTDHITENNLDDFQHSVTGSFDPNDKRVNFSALSPTSVANQDLLDYVIRFQNTGNDTAFTVVVRDSISANLEMGSFELLSASHPYTFRLLENGQAEWRFSNILLPDSNRNEPASHGFIRYRLKPKNNLVIGDEIKARAAIYFDYNSPVLTNYAITVVADPLGIGSAKTIFHNFKLYPNPAKNYVIVAAEFKKNLSAKVTLVNMLGQVVSEVMLPADNQIHYQLPLKDLPKGVYIVQLQTEAGKQTQRLVVQ